MRRIGASWLPVLAHAAVLSPLLILVWDFWQGQLGANPIREVQFRTGRYALILLVITLACTPASRLRALRMILALRRPLGLYAFMYASLHLLNFVGLDYGFDLTLLWPDVRDKRYVFAGLAAFLCLVPVAVASGTGWLSRPGRSGVWRLRLLVYLAAAFAVLHFLWGARVNTRQPVLYGLVVLLLLLLRLAPAAVRAATRLRWRANPARLG